MFKNYKIVRHVLGVVICDSGRHCIGTMCARIEADNDWIEEQALELWSAVHFAVELGLQDLVLEYENKGLVDDYGHIIYSWLYLYKPTSIATEAKNFNDVKI